MHRSQDRSQLPAVNIQRVISHDDGVEYPIAECRDILTGR